MRCRAGAQRPQARSRIDNWVPALRRIACALRLVRDTRAELVPRRPEAQRLGAEQGQHVALPLPGLDAAQRCDEFVVRLSPGRRAGTVLDLAGDEDHGVAGDGELALAALAPELQHHLAI